MRNVTDSSTGNGNVTSPAQSNVTGSAEIQFLKERIAELEGQLENETEAWKVANERASQLEAQLVAKECPVCEARKTKQRERVAKHRKAK